MRCFQIGICVLVLAAAVLAQGDRGSINGTVTDPVGAVVPGASIVVNDTTSPAQYRVVTTETGNYTVAQLPPGIYNLSVEAAGFTKFIQQGVRVLVSETVRVDVVLALGSTSESVTITADAPLVNTETAEQTYNISVERYNDLPINFAERLRNSVSATRTTGGLFLGGITRQDAAHRGAASLKAAGDLGFADTGAMQLPNFRGVYGRSCRPAQTLPVFPRVSQARLGSFSQDLSFELREDCQ